MISTIIESTPSTMESTICREDGFKRTKILSVDFLCCFQEDTGGKRELYAFVGCMKESDSLEMLEKVTASRFQTVGDKTGMGIEWQNPFIIFQSQELCPAARIKLKMLHSQ